jgi:hypothetical protein
MLPAESEDANCNTNSNAPVDNPLCPNCTPRQETLVAAFEQLRAAQHRVNMAITLGKEAVERSNAKIGAYDSLYNVYRKYGKPFQDGDRLPKEYMKVYPRHNHEDAIREGTQRRKQQEEHQRKGKGKVTRKSDEVEEHRGQLRDGIVRGRAKHPGMARGSGTQPGMARGSGTQPGMARGSGTQPGMACGSGTESGMARGSGTQSRIARGHSKRGGIDGHGLTPRRSVPPDNGEVSDESIPDGFRDSDPQRRVSANGRDMANPNFVLLVLYAAIEFVYSKFLEYKD